MIHVKSDIKGVDWACLVILTMHWNDCDPQGNSPRARLSLHCENWPLCVPRYRKARCIIFVSPGRPAYALAWLPTNKITKIKEKNLVSCLVYSSCVQETRDQTRSWSASWLSNLTFNEINLHLHLARKQWNSKKERTETHFQTRDLGSKRNQSVNDFHSLNFRHIFDQLDATTFSQWQKLTFRST